MSGKSLLKDLEMLKTKKEIDESLDSSKLKSINDPSESQSYINKNLLN